MRIENTVSASTPFVTNNSYITTQFMPFSFSSSCLLPLSKDSSREALLLNFGWTEVFVSEYTRESFDCTAHLSFLFAFSTSKCMELLVGVRAWKWNRVGKMVTERVESYLKGTISTLVRHCGLHFRLQSWNWLLLYDKLIQKINLRLQFHHERSVAETRIQ